MFFSPEERRKKKRSRQSTHNIHDSKQFSTLESKAANFISYYIQNGQALNNRIFFSLFTRKKYINIHKIYDK